MRTTISSGRVALVLSSLALLIALGGTAYAVNTVRSADIVDGTIQSRDIGTAQVASVDIKQGTVTSADVAPSSLGRSPRLFAHINDNMTLGGSRGVTAYSTTGGGPKITFDRNISQCAITATAHAPGIGNTYATWGWDGAPNRTIIVATWNPEGSLVEVPADVIVVC